MRYKFIILFLILGFVSKAQVYQLMPQYGYNTYRMNFDSTIQIPTFCGVPKLGSNVTKKGALAFDSCNNRFYFFNPKFQVWDTIKSADASLFVKYTDTAQMLLPYLKKQDTVSLSNRIEGRIDSLKLSNDSIYARKNNQFVFQYMNDTATVVKASVRNSESFTINRGQVVYIFGASGDKASVKLADNSGDVTSSRTLGIVRESIAAGQIGWVTTQGQVGKLQLGAYNEGDILWLDSIPGGFTKTKPVAPRHSVFLGVVERANNGNGIVYVKPQNGYELGELHDVKITSPQTNEVLAYTTNIWENKNIYSIVDTTSLSNRINTKLNISDTSAMLSPYLRSIDTTNKYVTSVFRKTASDSVFFVRGGTNNFAFRDSAGGANIYNTDGSLTGARTLTLNSQPLTIAGSTSSRFFANGNVGIGTTTDNGFKLDINGQTRTNALGIAAGSGATPTLSTQQPFDIIINENNAITSRFYNSGAGGSKIRLQSGQNGADMQLQFTNGATPTWWAGAIFCNVNSGMEFRVGQNSTESALNSSSRLKIFNTGNVGIGTTTDVASSLLTLESTSKGFLRPRMTTSQMNAISTPATGLSVFNTTDSLPYVYRGTSSGWQKNVTYTRTNDIGLLNGADQRLMIEPTTNVVAGRTLTVEAGSTQAGGTSAFTGLSQTARDWWFIKAAPNGDVYATTSGSGDVYKRTGGTGNFVALGQTSRIWYGIAAQSNGDVFIAVSNGFIYKQTGGTGNFVAVHSTSRVWRGMAVASNNDLYATVDNGDIYKSTDNGVTFTGLGQTSRAWRGITVAPNGDIYATVSGGDIYKSTGGGNFIGLGQTSRLWLDITTTSNGDIYATALGNDIWRSTNGGTTFTALGQTVRNWSGIGAAPNGDIYATAGVNTTSDIFLQSQGTANLNGGTLVLQSGVGKGTGTSTINFNTGTTLSSGSTLQTASTKMTILGNGNVGIGTTSPSAKLELSDTARGFLQTRMTTTQMNAIASPSVGLQVFTTTDSSQYVYRGTGAGWQQLANEIVNTGTLDFPSTNAQNSSDLTITLTGAVDGDAVVLGVPNVAVNANSCYTAWVSAANTVTIRLNNYSSGAIDPASATFKVTIIK